MGGIARDQGRLDDALKYYGSALRAIEQIGGSRWAVGCLHSNLGATRNRRGEIREAREYLKLSLELLEHANIREFLPETHRHMAVTELLAGQLSAAEAEATQALEMARELTMRGDEGCALGVLGEIASARGDLAEAERFLTESVAVLREVGDKYQSARSELTLARVLLRQGRTTEAAALLVSCTAVFRELEAQLDLASAEELQRQVPLAK